MAGCGIWVWTVTFTRWKIAESPQSLHKHFESHICLSNKRVWSKQRLRAVWNKKFHWSPLSVFTLCLLQLVFARFFLEYLACFHARQRRMTKKSKSSAALLSVLVKNIECNRTGEQIPYHGKHEVETGYAKKERELVFWTKPYFGWKR